MYRRDKMGGGSWGGRGERRKLNVDVRNKSFGGVWWRYEGSMGCFE